MAETEKKTESKQNVGVMDKNVTDTPDTAAAAKAGLSEGDIKALRDDAGLNGSAGHTANLATWENSPQGKEFAKGEKDRQKAEEEQAKKYDEQSGKDGLTPAEVAYFEAVDKGKK